MPVSTRIIVIKISNEWHTSLFILISWFLMQICQTPNTKGLRLVHNMANHD